MLTNAEIRSACCGLMTKVVPRNISELNVSYAKTIEDDFDKRDIVQVGKSGCFRVDNRGEWYLPHHPVFHLLRPGNVRRVLNGAANFHRVSLNRKLLTGPDLLQTLIHVLMRFRQHPYAVSADIEGMFLQVGVIPEDRTSIRFCCWRTYQQTSRSTKTKVTFLIRKIHQRVPTLLCNRLLVTTESNSPKL